MENAIKKAIEGGYEPDKIKMYGASEWRQLLLLDPDFWKCLGKALGWGYDFVRDPSEIYDQEQWKDEWHRFIDHLASGKSADSFFEELLK